MEDHNTQEEWRPIVGYEGLYEVSNMGRVRRLYKHQARLRKMGQHQRGYYQVVLSKHSKLLCYTVHSLVARAFIGPRPEGFEINHLDGIKTNNRVDNLEYCTQSENTRHAIALKLRR